jgi:hypothetical protein
MSDNGLRWKCRLPRCAHRFLVYVPKSSMINPIGTGGVIALRGLLFKFTKNGTTEKVNTDQSKVNKLGCDNQSTASIAAIPTKFGGCKAVNSLDRKADTIMTNSSNGRRF